MALQLYLIFWCIFIIVSFVFLFIKFTINFFKLNGVKVLLILFKKQNRLLLILNLTFNIIFWLAFYNIFYIRVYPQLRIMEEMKNNVYADGCIIGYDCKKINKININYKKDITLEITEYTKKYIKFKLNSNVFVNKCDNCNFDILEANKEYKMDIDEIIQFNIIDTENNLKYNYIISLD